ncbi:MAG TPA: hypothetical protein VEH04_07065 [Verrucomicrobiae bacterium]|nr:hypothetical protein [Verrucomicrobiae bacterium]
MNNDNTDNPGYTPKRLQWNAFLIASLIAGFVLMVVPRASPWSGLTFFAPVVMGRVLPEDVAMPIMTSKTLHLGLSLLYGLLISLAVSRIAQLWAVLTGALVGLGLYAANLAVVSAAFPELRGDETVVAFAHLFFGGIVGGAYRGLLRRRVNDLPSAPEEGHVEAR